MVATVRIDFGESDGHHSEMSRSLRQAAIVDFYQKVVADQANHADGLAIILHVDGFDIASKCAHAEALDRHDDGLF